MAAKYAKHMSTKMTPPTEKVRGKDQVINNAGGAVFQVGDFERLKRFLILGAECGTYYAGERKLTKENADCVLRCLSVDPKKTIDTIIEISDSGRAPKNDPAIFALALCAGFGDEAARALAYLAMPSILRTPTHLFAFVESVKEFRGFGSGLRKAIERWYNLKGDDDLAFSLVKYQSRNGWSHRDVFRLAHPVADTPSKQAIYRWAVCGKDGLGPREVLRKLPNKPHFTASYPSLEGLPRIIRAFEEAKTADERTLVRLVREENLPRECVPTQHLNSADVWEALLEKMPMTAMIRNLGKMTAVGLLKPLSDAAKTVASRLGDQAYLKKSRVHPIAILMALKVYGQGHGDKGKLTWDPVATVRDALDAAFYLSFGNVEPSNKRTLLGVDVSSSMDGNMVAGTSLSAREVVAAIAMVTVKTEPDYAIMGFSNRLVPIDLTKATSLSQVINTMQQIPMGGTDCSLPIKYAEYGKIPVDTFVTLTDCETWASGDPYTPNGSNEWAWGSRSGTGQCFQWLKKYRDTMGIPARNIVAAFTATNFTIADPSDPLSLDVAGCDSNTPSLISDFSAGRI